MSEWIVRSLPQTSRAIHKRMDRKRRATGAELEDTGLRIYAKALNRIPISAGRPKGSGYIRSEPGIVQIGFDAFDAPPTASISMRADGPTGFLANAVEAEDFGSDDVVRRIRLRAR